MTTAEKLIGPKMNLLELAGYLNDVSEACRVVGYSRDTFYRVKKAHDEGGLEARFELINVPHHLTFPPQRPKYSRGPQDLRGAPTGRADHGGSLPHR